MTPKVTSTETASPQSETLALKEQVREVALDRDIPTFDKRREIAQLIVDQLEFSGRFLRTVDRRGFFFDDSERHLYDIEQTEFERLVTAISGLSTTEGFFKFTINIIQTRAHRQAAPSDIHSFACFDPIKGVVTVSDGAGGVWVRESRGEWEYQYNGSSGIVFLTDPDAAAWVPEFTGNSGAMQWYLDQFLFGGDWMSAAESKSLLYMWLLQQFFPPLRQTRMIPAFLGPQGSGKTTAARLIGRLLIGRNFQVTGLRRDKEDAFIASVTNQVALGLDNADSHIPWLADSLALYATGQRYRMRQLYTTNEEVSYLPRAILMITSRDPRFNRPDVAERLLPLHCSRPASYIAEEAIFKQLDENRRAILGALLTRVGEILDSLPSYQTRALPFRMADFASFGDRVLASAGGSEMWSGLLGRLEHAQAGFASEGDGMIEALGELLQQCRSVSAMPISELFERCEKIATAGSLLFPKTAQAFGKRMSNMRRVIELELDVKIQDARVHAGKRLITITPTNGDNGGDGDEPE